MHHKFVRRPRRGARQSVEAMLTFRNALPLVALAFSSFGCSEAVPVASEGAYAVSFLQAGAASGNCKVASHNIAFGSVSAVALDALEKDSVDGAKLQCSVTRNGAGFAAAGILEDSLGNHLDFLIPSISAAATEAAPAMGNVGFRSAKTQNTYNAPSDEPCKFWITGKEQIDGGRIWVSFKCETVSDPSHDSSCQIAPGSTLAMQNCDE